MQEILACITGIYNGFHDLENIISLHCLHIPGCLCNFFYYLSMCSVSLEYQLAHLGKCKLK